MAADPRPQNFVEADQGYTQENLEGDFAASTKALSESNVLDEINRDLAMIDTEIETLTSQANFAMNNPQTIPVPADFQANPLMAIGATLRAIGGDASSLDGLIAQKRQVAAYQKQVAAQNIGIQNQFAAEQRLDQRNQLRALRDRQERFEYEKANILDEVAATGKERGIAAFETRVAALEGGIGTAESIINDFPQEFADSKYGRGFLTALERRGQEALAAERAKALGGGTDGGSKGMYSGDWEDRYGESVGQQLQEIAAGGISPEELEQRVSDVMTDIVQLETQSEGGEARRRQYIDRLAEALSEGGMADEAARIMAEEEVAKAEAKAAEGSGQKEIGDLLDPFYAAGRFLERNFDNPFTGIAEALGYGQNPDAPIPSLQRMVEEESNLTPERNPFRDGGFSFEDGGIQMKTPRNR